MTFLIGAVRNWEPQSNHKGKLPTQPATRNKNEIKTTRPQGQIFITPGRASCRAANAFSTKNNRPAGRQADVRQSFPNGPVSGGWIHTGGSAGASPSRRRHHFPTNEEGAGSPFPVFSPLSPRGRGVGGEGAASADLPRRENAHRLQT